MSRKSGQSKLMKGRRLNDFHSAALMTGGRATAVAFSLDGKTLATGSDDNTVRFWDAKFSSYPTYLCQHLTRNLTHAEWAEFVDDFLPCLRDH
jgi:WD40 repeat protein